MLIVHKLLPCATSYACNATGAWHVALDFPCSGRSGRYNKPKKISHIYHTFVATEKCVGGRRGRKSGKKEMVAIGGKTPEL